MSLPGHRSVRRALALLAVIVLTLAGLTAVASTALAAGDPCGPGGNPIACENSLPGADPEEWDTPWGDAGDSSIQGFSTDISVNAGSPISFKVDTDASAYTITIYRIGYYGGDGARRITTVPVSAPLPQHQPECIQVAATELTDCGNWGVSATWSVPSTAVSGVYIAKLHRADLDEMSHITFIVRNDASHSDIVFQTSDTTWQAYNSYGGSSFYTGGANGRAYELSYNRPVVTRSGNTMHDFFFANEYPAVRFLERNGYDVSYIAGVDTDRRGELLQNHEVFLSVGHDEYWSGQQRANVEAARDAGVNLQFLSGNEVYWRTRYQPSKDDSHTPYRTLVSYKESWSNAKIDPSVEWTGTWRDPRFAAQSAGGGRAENALTGTIFMSNLTDLPITVTRAQGKTRLWRGTGLASMTGASTELAPHTVGYESDENQDNGARPPGIVNLSTTTGPVAGQYMWDYGSTTGDGTTTHSITLYRASSGALVFGAGTVQWSWGLDDQHDTPFEYEPADRRMQQAQVNLLADMGAQPTTLMAGLVAATASTDTTGPTVVVDTPAVGATRANGAQVSVTGTASDTGGGVVAGVEYSTDGGTSWHPAEGTSAWSFRYVQHGIGNVPVQVRAVDDSVNLGPSVSRAVSVSCPCSVFGASDIPTSWTSATGPATAATNDAGSAELGLRFTPQVAGFVTGVRFYKGAGNTGTHVGSLWNSGGQRLASVTFSAESESGWQTAQFATPVAVAAGVSYVVSYTAPNGHYAHQSWAFGAAGLEAYPLEVAGGFGAIPAGVYGNEGTFPALSHENSNYFVDVTFSTTDDSPLIATNQWPLPGSSSVPVDTTISARYTKPIATGSHSVSVTDQNGEAVAGSVSYAANSRTVSFVPSEPLSGFVTYTVRLGGTDTQGTPLTTGKTWSFTTARPPAEPGVCPCTLFDETTVPVIVDATDGQPLTLGVRFASSQDGLITGIRFYKGPSNTGTHVGTLWSATGTALATGTFSDESSSGWQTLEFGEPVAITKDTEYYATYYSPTGSFSLTPNDFGIADRSRPPLRVAATSGAFAYGAGFPNTTSASNYLVDPVFTPPMPSMDVASQSPAPGATGVERGTPVTVRFTAPLAPGWSLAVTQDGVAVAGSTLVGNGGRRLTFTPAQPFGKDVEVSVQVDGVVSVEDVALPDLAWSFHTNGDDDVAAPQSLFGDETPAIAGEPDDTSAVELGTAFVPARNGRITAIRFFKGPGNGGTHTGSIWSASGSRLATVTFTDETATGWQTAVLTSPLPVVEGTRYVVSYLAPQGHYAHSAGFFASPWQAGDLTAPAGGNGLYEYGGGFPTYSWNSSNYFVDVVFKADPPTISMTDRTPQPGATGVMTAAEVSVTFSSTVADGWSLSATAGGAPVPGTATLAGDRKSITFEPAGPLPAGTTVTVTVSDVVSTAGAVLPTATWSFATESAPTVLTSMFAGLTPATAAADDGGAVELGTAFTPAVDGVVTAVRFYKGPDNTGAHTGSVWTSSGTRIATVTFQGETATGWQTATFTTPVQLTAGQTYVVSYFAPNGRYAMTGGYFATPRSFGPLSTPTTNNGRYRYGGGFPTNSWNATNYFVDVVFRSEAP